MYRFDYHLHTDHSMDCDMPMDTLCRAAIDAGLGEICVTEHFEPGHPAPGSDIPPDVDAWLADIAAARARYPQLTIRQGIEIGDNPLCRDAIHAWLEPVPLDFRLLSLHLIGNADPYIPGFFEGREQEPFYREYVEAKLESALAWAPESFDSFGHLGYCAKFAPYPLEERPLRLRHAPDHFDALFTVLAQGGKALEINTSGYYSVGECIPDRELVSRFAALGGEFVTLGSDAHVPGRVGAGLEAAVEMVKASGIRYALVFERRKPRPVAL